MLIGPSVQQSPGSVRRRPGVHRILAFAFVFALAGGSAAQQSPPVGSTARPASKAPSPFLEAEALLRQGSVAEAKVKIEEQLKLNPSSVEGYNLLGIAYGSEKDYDKALEAFQHALKLDPESARTHNNLGNVYVAQEKFDLAEREFGQVLRLDPGNREANYNLGLVLMARRSPVEAISHFQRVHPADMATRFN
ncbi:MAG: tetratricopeptide repeat protein, partial [Terriglobales bacterium]